MMYEDLGKALEESVRTVCEDKRVGIAFSGGMDSGLLAALASRYAKSVTCYTCGTDDAFDVAAGKELAEKLGTNQTYIAALERGRKNITFSTLARYAAACGKKVALL